MGENPHNSRTLFLSAGCEICVVSYSQFTWCACQWRS